MAYQKKNTCWRSTVIAVTGGNLSEHPLELGGQVAAYCEVKIDETE